jgi:hypothetical protein
MAMMLSLNEEALDAAGIDEADARDIVLLIQGMADPAARTMSVTETESETSPEPETMTEPETIAEAAIEESSPPTGNNSDPVVFRIQIISSLYENSFPTVLIDGISYKTHEYYYMGSYRITVGRFTRLEEANAFRTRCLDSGFKQAFVAAFREGERVTDPAVFKQ